MTHQNNNIGCFLIEVFFFIDQIGLIFSIINLFETLLKIEKKGGNR